MDDKNGFRSFSNRCLYLLVIYLQGVKTRFHKHRLQPVLRNGKYGGNESVGRHDDLIARLHHTQFYVGTEYPDKRIQPVADTYAIVGTDILSVIPFKPLILLSLKVPTAIHHTAHRLVNLIGIFRRNAF